MQADPPNGMKLFRQAPRPALDSFVQSFRVIEFTSRHHDTHLPDTGPVAAFSFRGGCRLDGAHRVPAAAFTGLRETLRAHEHDRGHAVLLATFTPVGAAAFLRTPLEEFSGETIDLCGVLGHATEVDGLHEEIARAPNHARRVTLLEEFLLARLHAPEPDPLIAAAVAWINRREGPRRIEELTQHIGLSQSALERRFRRVVGVSPKKFATLVRLQHAVRLRRDGADLTAVAHAAGYFDQSHFINDFRRAAGTSPEAYFRTSARPR